MLHIVNCKFIIQTHGYTENTFKIEIKSLHVPCCKIEFPLSPLADISDGCNLSSISRKRDVRLCVCKNRNNVQETAIKAMNSADLQRERRKRNIKKNL